MYAKGRPEEGGRAYDRAVALIESLPVGSPSVARDRYEIATLFARMCSQTYCGTAQAEQVIPFYKRAIVAWDRVVTGFPSVPVYSELRASAFSYLANRLFASRQLGEAESVQRQALEIREAMMRADPTSTRLRRQTAIECELMAILMAESGLPREAERWFVRASALDATRLTPKNDLAWLLATCQDPAVRDPARAVAMAEEVVAARPRVGAFWNTLGLAKLRAGDWAGAQAALEESMRLCGGGQRCDWLAVALVRWHRGDPADARRWYEGASGRTDGPPGHPDPVAAELQAEVASLLDPPSAGSRPRSQ
jgi:tetratricopeptide (TPR) repeat protein